VTIPDAKATSKAEEEIGFAHRSESEIDCTASRFLTGAAFSAVTFVFCVLFRVIIDDHRDYFFVGRSYALIVKRFFLASITEFSVKNFDTS